MTDPLLLDIETPDAHRFQATLFRADDVTAPTLIFLPALGTASRVYKRLGQSLVNHGVNVCIPDWRGMASSSLRASRSVDFGYLHLLEHDVSALLIALRKILPKSRFFLGGHSLGGQLALLAAATHDDNVSGVVMIATGTVHLPCYPIKMQVGIRFVVAAARLSGALIGYFPGDRLGFGGREARSVMRDWGQVAHTGHYRIASSNVDYEAALKRMTRPVLAINFAADHWSPALAAKKLLEKSPSAQITQLHWAKDDTDGVALDHFSWLKHPHLVTPTLAHYLQAPITIPS